ncbi:MAG: MarC family protein [Deltaproteobacteria bacterium]|nr:MarC family protein [Deltaproteobacteria bacterium]
MPAQLAQDFYAVFVPLFVALSPLTVLPLFMSIADGLGPAQERSLAKKGVLTAFLVALGVTLAGQGLFRLLGITVDDLRIAGGLILLVISMHDLIFSRETRKGRDRADDDGSMGIVPLGVPLIVGPATLTACLVLVDTHGRLLVIAALLVNLGIIAAILLNARRLLTHIRPPVIQAFGKVMSLFLAAIAVAMVRVGVSHFITG